MFLRSRTRDRRPGQNGWQRESAPGPRLASVLQAASPRGFPSAGTSDLLFREEKGRKWGQNHFLDLFGGGRRRGDAVHVRLFMLGPAESDTGAPGAGQEAEGYGERDADCKDEANNDDQDEADAAPIRAPAPADAVRDAARRRLAPAVFECAFNTHAVVHAPAEVLIEGPGFVEHKVDIRDLCGNQNFTARSC